MSRLRALALAPFRWLAILLVPDRALPEAVSAGRYAGAMLAATAAALLAAFTIAPRVDVSQRVFAAVGAEGGGGGGAGASGAAGGPGEPGMSDREIEEAFEKARTVELVKRGLTAGARPLQLLGLGLLLYGLARYVGGRPTLRRAVALASSSALPGAVRALLEALAASRRTLIAPADVEHLVVPPLRFGSPIAERLAGGLDPFALWSVALIALGTPRMAGIGWRRSLLTVAVGFALWLVLTRLVLAAPSNPGAPP